MNLMEYAVYINEMLKKHGKKEVYYSSDDEGNDFEPVHFKPSTMKYDGKVVVCIN